MPCVFLIFVVARSTEGWLKKRGENFDDQKASHRSRVKNVYSAKFTLKSTYKTAFLFRPVTTNTRARKAPHIIVLTCD